MAKMDLGDKVFHDGHEDLVIVGIGPDITVFENECFRVECGTRELVWGDLKGAWYLPGRLYPREQRQVMRDAGIKVLEYEKKIMAVREEQHG